MAYVNYDSIAPIIAEHGWTVNEQELGGRGGNWTSYFCFRPEYQLVFFGHDSDQLVELGFYEVSNPSNTVEIAKICLSDEPSPTDAAIMFLDDMYYRYINC